MGGGIAWTEVASQARLIRAGRVADAERVLAGWPGALSERAGPLLAEMAACSPDAAGVRRASEALRAALPGLAAPGGHGASGGDPGVATVKQCALLVLHGLLARAGAAARTAPDREAAVALVAAARAIQGFNEALRDGLLDELAVALGPALYREATQRVVP